MILSLTQFLQQFITKQSKNQCCKIHATFSQNRLLPLFPQSTRFSTILKVCWWNWHGIPCMDGIWLPENSGRWNKQFGCPVYFETVSRCKKYILQLCVTCFWIHIIHHEHGYFADKHILQHTGVYCPGNIKIHLLISRDTVCEWLPQDFFQNANMLLKYAHLKHCNSYCIWISALSVTPAVMRCVLD